MLNSLKCFTPLLDIHLWELQKVRFAHCKTLVWQYRIIVVCRLTMLLCTWPIQWVVIPSNTKSLIAVSYVTRTMCWILWLTCWYHTSRNKPIHTKHSSSMWMTSLHDHSPHSVKHTLIGRTNCCTLYMQVQEELCSSNSKCESSHYVILRNNCSKV